MATLDLTGEHADRAYPILASLVILPRPIAWVTTLNEDGSVNAAPFSYFNVFGSQPAAVGVRARATGRRAGRRTPPATWSAGGEFVVHLADEEVLEADGGDGRAPGLRRRARWRRRAWRSRAIRGGGRAAAGGGVPAAFECRVHSVQRIGQQPAGGGHDRLGGAAGRAVRCGTTSGWSRRKIHPVGRMASPDW